MYACAYTESDVLSKYFVLQRRRHPGTGVTVEIAELAVGHAGLASRPDLCDKFLRLRRRMPLQLCRKGRRLPFY